MEEIDGRLTRAIKAGEFDEAVYLANEYRRLFERIWDAIATESRAALSRYDTPA